ncbi:MAG: hypothetical protein LBS70_03160 [Candidatus Accumulibacter sp.]|nr:hypothetical protein [Accumulibacter sp.]
MEDALALLDRIGESHRRMAAMADKLDWDNLAAEWQAIQPALAELRDLAIERRPPAERAEAAKRATELLALQKHITDRVAPWLDQARPLIEVFRKYPIKRPAPPSPGAR